MYFINDDTRVCRYKNGIKIIAPQKAQKAIQVPQLLALPFNTYFLDSESRLIKGNDYIAETHHLTSLKSIVGKDIRYYIPNRNEAERIIFNDKLVRENNVLQFLNEKYSIDDNEITSYISLKMPVYDSRGESIGIFGCSKLLNKGVHEAINFLNYLSQIQLISLDFNLKTFSLDSPTNLQKYIFNNELQLTPREKELVDYIVKGRTAKTISANLNISMRTVEAHINNLKKKIGVDSKAELIERLLHIYY